jgi:hypothetical protein
LEFPPEKRRRFEWLNGVVKVSLKLALIFSGGKIVSTIIRQSGENYFRQRPGAGIIAGAWQRRIH